MGKKISKPVKKQLLNIGFLLILIAVTLIVLFTATDIRLHDIGVFLSQCNPWLIAAALAAMVLFILFEAISLHFILHGLGEKPRFHSSIVYSTADTYYSAITPSASGGQPASAIYMVKDGIAAGKASFSLVFNIAAYTFAVIVIGVVALAVRPGFFSMIDGWFPKLLVILGFVIQGLLFAFFIGCMFWGGAVRKVGNGIIGLLTKLHIVKKPDKWKERLAREVEKYKDCLGAIKRHPGMTFINFFCNLGQRVSHVLIPCFVFYAADSSVNFLDLFACSAFVTIGYNSIPLPGGVGVYEYLYPSIYCIVSAEEAFVLSALMVSRAISYYMSMMLSGVYTLVYHAVMMHRKPKELPQEEPSEPSSGADPPGEAKEALAEPPGEAPAEGMADGEIQNGEDYEENRESGASGEQPSG